MKPKGQTSTIKPSDKAPEDTNPGWAKLTGGATKLGGSSGGSKPGTHKMGY